MDTTRFTVEIGDDQTIRPPEGVVLPPGRVDVIVVHPSGSRVEDGANDVSEVPLVARDLAALAAEIDADGLPSDLALNHDHYLYGVDKREQRP